MTTFDELYRVCNQGISRHVGRMLWRYKDDTEDVLQECWCKVFRALPAMHEDVGYQWVARIATNTAIDALRAHALHQRLAGWLSLDYAPEGTYDDERAWEEITAGAPDVSEGVLTSEFTRTVLAGVTPHNRRILLLRCAGYSYEEIAAYECATGGTVRKATCVKNTIQHARQQARAVRARESCAS